MRLHREIGGVVTRVSNTLECPFVSRIAGRIDEVSLKTSFRVHGLLMLLSACNWLLLVVLRSLKLSKQSNRKPLEATFYHTNRHELSEIQVRA